MRTPKIKPCPFCGHSAKYYDDMGIISCVNTPYGCGFLWQVEGALSENIKRWNERKPETSAIRQARTVARDADALRRMLETAVTELLTLLDGRACTAFKCHHYRPGKGCKAGDCRAAALSYLARGARRL